MKKRILSLILVCAMMVGVISAMSLSVSAAVNSNSVGAAAYCDTAPTVDGTIEDAWNDATPYLLEINAAGDVKEADGGLPKAKPGESSSVQFRVMYSDTKVYVLFEIYDDTWINPGKKVTSSEYKYDSLFICVNEEPTMSHSWGTNTYVFCGYINPDLKPEDNFFVRSGKGTNANDKEYAVKVDGENAIVELSFELNNIENVNGNRFWFDVQYNDCDQQTYVSRSVVWNWSCKKESSSGITGAASGKGSDCPWGMIGLGVDPKCTVFPNEKVDVLKADSLVVDGVIDEAWSAAEVQTLGVVGGQSAGNADTREASSTVKFRTMYSENKVYILFEIYDDVWANGVNATDYKNDSLFICVCEAPNPAIGNNTEGSESFKYCKISNATYNNNGKAYTFRAYPDTGAATTTEETLGSYFSAKTGSHSLSKEFAVKEVDANNRIVELCFELKSFDAAEGNSIYLDVQYNDCDSADYSTSRTVVWNWSTKNASSSGKILSAALGGSEWGKLNFIGDPTITHHDGKANGASFYYQASADGSSYRIVGLIEEASLANIESIKITFSNGETTKSITVTSAKAYSSIDATFDSVTVTYVAEEGSVILGWVITGIDEEGYTPSAVAVINS